MELEWRYDREYTGSRLEYAQVDLINVLLNYLKALEYHYRDDVRVERNPEYNKAMRLFRRIAEQVDPKETYSPYRLKGTGPKGREIAKRAKKEGK
jgi:hypothetical protein